MKMCTKGEYTKEKTNSDEFSTFLIRCFKGHIPFNVLFALWPN